MKDDEPVWISLAESLVQALEIARQAGAGSYLIFSQETRNKSRYEVDASGLVKPMDKAKARGE